MTLRTDVSAEPRTIQAEEVTNASAWEAFMLMRPHASFLQSWAWGEFQQELGRKVTRLAVVESDQIKAAAQAIVIERRLGRLLYVPHGPIVDWTDGARRTALMSGLLALARHEGVHYLRVQPREPNSEDLQRLLKSLGLRPAPISDQPYADLLLNIDGSNSDANLLGQMRPTTRNLIKKASRLGVSVTNTDDPKALNIFHTLLAQTAKRGRFKPQPRAYLQKQFEVLSRYGHSRLFVAWRTDGFEPTALAAAVIILYGDTATYVHAASRASRIPGAYLVVWAAIQHARERAMTLFDLWGVEPSGRKPHSWRGLSLFKRGFGGDEVSYLTAWDLPLRLRYSAVYLMDAYYYGIIRPFLRQAAARMGRLRQSSGRRSLS